jgi:hypothetical protein
MEAASMRKLTQLSTEIVDKPTGINLAAPGRRPISAAVTLPGFQLQQGTAYPVKAYADHPRHSE